MALAEASSTPHLGDVPRWELYRLLADEVRVRLLALVALEELGVGELADLLGEGLTKVSRHAAALRDAGLVSSRRNGTWVLLRLAPQVEGDAVVSDALATGRVLTERDGSAARVDAVVRARDEKAREFFARDTGEVFAAEPPTELAAYLSALAPLLPRRALAVDAGTGDGSLLDVLCPLFEHVVALDRSPAQLRRAEARAARRGFEGVAFVSGELDGPEIERAVLERAPGGADVVFASRILHHAPQPARALEALARLVRPATATEPGGLLVILDYAAHEDLALKEAQADLWAGFEPDELVRFAREAGLSGARVAPLPRAFQGHGPDRHLTWILFTASRPEGASLAAPTRLQWGARPPTPPIASSSPRAHRTKGRTS